MTRQALESALRFMATLAALLAAQPAIAGGMSVRTLASEEARLSTIAYRLAVANAGTCSRPEALSGLILHDLTQYDAAKRTAVARAFSLHDGIGVLQLVPGSSAAEAGLMIDDEIEAVNGYTVREGRAVSSGRKSFDRMERFTALLQNALARGQANLQIRRRGQPLTVRLSARLGCGGRLALRESAVQNAWSDGRHVFINSGMAKLAGSEDEIAFVIAHEMAHNILGHSAVRAQSIYGAPVRSARTDEIDADQLAVRLMIDAGYRPQAGISFLETASRKCWWQISLDHPSFSARIRAVRSAIQSADPARQLAGTKTSRRNS
ncbi:MAG: M48 family metalloprotease [Sphingomicrobium sp.]